jgi:hypothetical protein
MNLNVSPQLAAQNTRSRFTITKPVRIYAAAQLPSCIGQRTHFAVCELARRIQGNEASFPWSRSSGETAGALLVTFVAQQK